MWKQFESELDRLLKGHLSVLYHVRKNCRLFNFVKAGRAGIVIAHIIQINSLRIVEERVQRASQSDWSTSHTRPISRQSSHCSLEQQEFPAKVGGDLETPAQQPLSSGTAGQDMNIEPNALFGYVMGHDPSHDIAAATAHAINSVALSLHRGKPSDQGVKPSVMRLLKSKEDGDDPEQTANKKKQKKKKKMKQAIRKAKSSASKAKTLEFPLSSESIRASSVGSSGDHPRSEFPSPRISCETLGRTTGSADDDVKRAKKFKSITRKKTEKPTTIPLFRPFTRSGRASLKAENRDTIVPILPAEPMAASAEGVDPSGAANAKVDSDLKRTRKLRKPAGAGKARDQEDLRGDTDDPESAMPVISGPTNFRRRMSDVNRFLEMQEAAGSATVSIDRTDTGTVPAFAIKFSQISLRIEARAFMAMGAYQTPRRHEEFPRKRSTIAYWIGKEVLLVVPGTTKHLCSTPDGTTFLRYL